MTGDERQVGVGAAMGEDVQRARGGIIGRVFAGAYHGAKAGMKARKRGLSPFAAGYLAGQRARPLTKREMASAAVAVFIVGVVACFIVLLWDGGR